MCICLSLHVRVRAAGPLSRPDANAALMLWDAGPTELKINGRDCALTCLSCSAHAGEHHLASCVLLYEAITRLNCLNLGIIAKLESE